MNQQMYDTILASISHDAEMATAFKKLWKRYQQLNGVVMYGRMPDINIYYDKPAEEKPRGYTQ